MPWHIEHPCAKCPASKSWGVVKDADGTVEGCHPTEADAQAQLAALYASEPGAKMSSTAGLHYRADVDTSAWDAAAAMSACANSDTPASCYSSICAGEKTGDKATQAAHALPHHYPGKGPNADGTRNALSRLPQTDGLTNAAAAQAHLEAHMKQINPDYVASAAPLWPEARGARASLTIGADGSHDPLHGDHEHNHTAMGSQGGDEMHSHPHSHGSASGPDASHDHSHSDAAAAGSFPGAGRAEFFANQAGTGLIPNGSGRLQAFHGQLRATPVKRDGKEFFEVEGYASVVEQPYEMWDMFGPYDETVKAGAFDASLSRDDLDVAWLVNHKGVTMARTTNKTLSLWADTTGLGARAFLNAERQDVRDIVSAIDDELVDEMSFAFYLNSGGWDQTYMHFSIWEADIHRGDVSAVNYGANPFTSIAARMSEVMRSLDQLPAGAARAAVQRLAARADLGIAVSLGGPAVRGTVTWEGTGANGEPIRVIDDGSLPPAAAELAAARTQIASAAGNGGGDSPAAPTAAPGMSVEMLRLLAETDDDADEAAGITSRR